MNFEKVGGTCWKFNCKYYEEGQCGLEICDVLLSLIIEFMAQLENPALSVVEDACELLGHPIDPEDGKRCFCRLRKVDEGR